MGAVAVLMAHLDAAIVTIAWISGEGADLANDGFLDGTNILELTQNEKDMLKMVQDNFDTVIVLINSTNAMDCSFLYEYEIDAALWIGYTGEWGLNAVADILVGNVNPSGSLVDTYTFDNNSAPSVVGLYGSTWTNYTGNPAGRMTPASSASMAVIRRQYPVYRVLRGHLCGLPLLRDPL